MRDVPTALQDAICSRVEEAEGFGGGKFEESRGIDVAPGGGSAAFRITRVMQDASAFEKAGCSITARRVESPVAMLNFFKRKVSDFPALQTVIDAIESYNAAKQQNPSLPPPKFPFHSAALSLVFHPINPHIPTVHMNVRYFEIDLMTNGKNDDKVWWFGGGSDLTPYVLYDEDATHFHSTLKKASDKHNAEYYPLYKKQCDEYFVNKHRGYERRGVGGMFFDHLGAPPRTAAVPPSAKGSSSFWGGSSSSTPAATAPALATSTAPKKVFPVTPAEAYAFVEDYATAFLTSYFPIYDKRKGTSFTLEQSRWQRLRHGRYVEFNLVYDEGTKYGFEQPNANADAILMSLPLHCEYRYQYKPGSDEERLMKVLKQPREWAIVDTPAASSSTAAAATGAVPAPGGGTASK